MQQNIIDEMIAEFTTNCEARGGHVYHAKSTEDAMEWIRKLVKDKGVKTIVKSKSMASEEIKMNHVLAEDGVLVQETEPWRIHNSLGRKYTCTYGYAKHYI